jgi:elongation factor P
MSSVKATQLRPGMVIQHEGQLFTIFSVDHRTPGNKRGSMQTRMKNLKSGTMIDYRFRAEEFVDRAILDEVEFEYLYNEGDDFHFMNTETYEQMHLTRDLLGDTVYYLIPNTVVKVEFFEEKPIGVDLPDTMDLKVISTEPTLQKATASAVGKPATLETGLVVQVPPFVNEGDKIKVDTTEARYVQRVESSCRGGASVYPEPRRARSSGFSRCPEFSASAACCRATGGKKRQESAPEQSGALCSVAQSNFLLLARRTCG